MLEIVAEGRAEWGAGEIAAMRIRRRLHAEFPGVTDCVLEDYSRGNGDLWLTAAKPLHVHDALEETLARLERRQEARRG
jgi:hypothetical protein